MAVMSQSEPKKNKKKNERNVPPPPLSLRYTVSLWG